MRSIHFIYILIFSSLSLLTQESKSIELADKLVQAVYENSKVAGISISVGLKGKIIWHKGYGFADLEQEVPVHPDKSLFRVGSVAKPITTVAIAQLYEAGKLNLDAEVQKYVPSFPKKKWPITTRQLAGHLAGIRHYKGNEFLSTKNYPTVLEGLDIFKNDPLLHQPETKYKYSSYGWNLISAVIEGASGESFLDYMQKHVFEKIGMMNTHADHVKPIIKNRGRYYQFEDKTLVNSEWVDNSYKWAGGGFLSTSDDLVKFGFAHLDQSILNRETIKLLWSSQKTQDGKSTGYGIGWSSGSTKAGTAWVGHSGGSVGGTTMFLIVPEKELVVVMITNMSSFGMGRTAQEVTDIFMKGL
jgi:CubicO group peptidase (beta-lactamase class C family)